MSELSIFIDESGDVGTKSDYYIVTLLFHDQQLRIDDEIEQLFRRLSEINIPAEAAIHTGPLIRKEDEYRNYPLATRKAVFNRLFAFTRRSNIGYKCFSFEKYRYSDRFKLVGALSRDIAAFLREHSKFFLSYDHVVIYYDNGQAEITAIINTLFNAFFFDVDIRRVQPVQYRLFQSADLLCTLELERLKLAHNTLTRSDLIFFGSPRLLKKNYLQQIKKLSY